METSYVSAESEDKRWLGLLEERILPDQTTTLMFVKQFLAADSDAFLESYLFQQASEASIRVAKFYEQQLVDGQLRLCMEYCGGGTLLEWLQHSVEKQTPFTLEYVGWIIIKILETIVALHEHRIAHRKISMKSWIFADGDFPKLISFSMAKLIQVKGTTNQHTALNYRLYSSPEVIQASEFEGDLPINIFKQDVWAAGKVIFELLTSKVFSFLNTFPEDRLEDRVELELRRCGSLSMKTAILGMLNRDKNARFTAKQALQVTAEALAQPVFHNPESVVEDQQLEELMPDPQEDAAHGVHRSVEVCNSCHTRIAKLIRGMSCSHNLCESCFLRAKRSCPVCSSQSVSLNEASTEDVPCPNCHQPYRAVSSSAHCTHCSKRAS